MSRHDYLFVWDGDDGWSFALNSPVVVTVAASLADDSSHQATYWAVRVTFIDDLSLALILALDDSSYSRFEARVGGHYWSGSLDSETVT